MSTFYISKKILIDICEAPYKDYPLAKFSPNSSTENRAALTKFNKVIKNFLSKIGLDEVDFWVSKRNGNAEYQISDNFEIV